ncbi:MAG: HAD hydrolase-like protein [Oscillospiraceae bacterium]|nr:HAD hydrolase-like protein [Oscillospiraceae bacterium]
MNDILIDMNRKHDFLICVDSDGCVFDNMELKHKECFCPATVNVWNLQSVSRYAREAAEFVNLYSTTRGANRFPAIIRTLELLGEREEAKQRGYVCPDLTLLKEWVRTTHQLSAAAIDEYVSSLEDPDPILAQAAAWSREVDANIAHIVRGVTPFPGVREAFSKFMEFADIVIVSATPHEAIVREWGENDMLKYVTEVAGQELGTKADCIRKANSGHYAPDHVLMIGDAQGDYVSAKENGVLYYPIVPGEEVDSWKKALTEVADQLKNGTYAGEAMEKALAKFDSVLLKEPRWHVK